MNPAKTMNAASRNSGVKQPTPCINPRYHASLMKKKSFVPSDNFTDLLLDAVCVVDAQGCFVFVSAACERIFGYTPEEMLGKSMIDMVAPEDRERTQQAANEVMSGQTKPHFENRYVRKDGKVVHIMWSARWSETDQLRIGVARDITERKHAESMQAALYAISEAAHVAGDLVALFQQIHRIIETLLPAHNFSVALTDERSERLIFPYHVDQRDQASSPLHTSTGSLCKAVMRNGQPLLLTPETLADHPDHLRAVVDSNTLCWLGVPLDSHNGTIGVLALKSYVGGARYTEKDKELLRFVSNQVATAVERKQLHARLQHTAQYDELTDLPNRRLLYDRLETALARAVRKQGRLAVLYLDLDRFKQVNDVFGHAAGDLLLQEVARRLKQSVRETDTVARIGGDEFVVLLESVNSPGNASVVAEKIRDALIQPITIDGQDLYMQASIGIALHPEHGDGVQQLIKHADDAMYLGKKDSDGSVDMASEG